MASPSSQNLEDFLKLFENKANSLSAHATQLLKVFDPHKAFYGASPASTGVCVVQGKDKCISSPFILQVLTLCL